MIEFVCGECGAVLKVARAPAGGAVKCPKCGAAVPVSAKSHRAAARPAGEKPPAVPATPYVTFKCPNCRRRLRLGREYSGIGVKCPHCDASTVVPDADSATRAKAGQTVVDEPSLLKTAAWVAVGLLVVFGITMMLSMNREEPDDPAANRPTGQPPRAVATTEPTADPAARVAPAVDRPRATEPATPPVGVAPPAPRPVKTGPPARVAPATRPHEVDTHPASEPITAPKPKPTTAVAPAPPPLPAAPLRPAPAAGPRDGEELNAIRLLRLGNVYLTNGQKALAAAKFKEIIAAYPNTKTARQAKTRLAECK